MGLQLKTNVSAPLLNLFPASVDPLLAVRLRAIGGPVLRLVRPDGWMEDVRSELDLEVEGVVGPGDFVDGAKDFPLSDETKGTILWGERGERAG